MRGLRTAVRGPGETRGGRGCRTELHAVWKPFQTRPDQVLLVSAQPHTRVSRRHSEYKQYGISRNLPFPQQRFFVYLNNGCGGNGGGGGSNSKKEEEEKKCDDEGENKKKKTKKRTEE